MNINSPIDGAEAATGAPVLIVPYAWIGDFVRVHSVVKILRRRWPDRPVDILSTRLCAPLVDYMPGARKAVVWDLPRSRIALSQQWALAACLRQEGYGTALITPWQAKPPYIASARRCWGSPAARTG